MRIPEPVALAVASLFAPFAIACGGASEEPTAEASQAFTFDTFLVLNGVQGEANDNPHRGQLMSFSPTQDSTAVAMVITDCEGPLCRVVPVEATLVSNDDGPVTVWHLTGEGPSSDPWTSQLVVRTHASSPVLKVERLDVTGLALVDPPKKKKHGHGHGHGHEHGRKWERMAPESLVTCDQPSCNDQQGPEGWTCVPTCTLIEQGGDDVDEIDDIDD